MKCRIELHGLVAVVDEVREIDGHCPVVPMSGNACGRAVVPRGHAGSKSCRLTPALPVESINVLVCVGTGDNELSRLIYELMSAGIKVSGSRSLTPSVIRGESGGARSKGENEQQQVGNKAAHIFSVGELHPGSTRHDGL